MPDIVRGAHHWVGSANITISQQQASRAARRGTVRVIEEQTIDVLEVYCAACKRPYEACHKTTCVLGDHHRGGPIGERKKRKGQGTAGEQATQAPAGP